jgi:hypothetical protein
MNLINFLQKLMGKSVSKTDANTKVCSLESILPNLVIVTRLFQFVIPKGESMLFQLMGTGTAILITMYPSTFKLQLP